MNNNVIDRLQIIGGAEGNYIPEKNKVRFKASKKLLELINK